jgi:hypothetical protein
MAASANTISIQDCQILAFQPHGILVPRLDAVVACAKELNRPVERYRQEFVDAYMLAAIAQKIGEPALNDPRIILLICGTFLEEQISLAAQYMLVTGFEVYLLRGLVVPKSPNHANIYDLRLVQAGAVPTTLQQLVYEWMATEKDEVVRHELKKMSPV